METDVMDKPTISPIQDATKRRHAQASRQCPRSGKRLELAVGPEKLCSAFGVQDADVATRLLSQLMNVLNPAAGDAMDAAVIGEAIELVRGIAPKGALEALTAMLLLSAEHVALDCMRRALHPDQSPGGRQSYAALSLKAMRTFAQLVEALNHSRGKGVVTQQIIVSHVSVEPGAQAIVGTVAGGRG
jgi:hypothetical protein